MPYELAKELKDAGFPYGNKSFELVYPDGVQPPLYGPLEVLPATDLGVRVPRLEELVEACGLHFHGVFRSKRTKKFYAVSHRYAHKKGGMTSSHDTPNVAVARLWLALNKKV